MGAANENPCRLLGIARLKIAFSCLEEKTLDVPLTPAFKHFVQERLSSSLCIPLDVVCLLNFVAQLPFD